MQPPICNIEQINDNPIANINLYRYTNLPHNINIKKNITMNI